MNYIIRMDGREYTGYRDGRPFSLADAWREVKGVRNCDILAPNGRVVLANAGSMRVRTWDMPNLASATRAAAQHLRSARHIRTCPRCGVRCWRHRANGAWYHPPAGCDLEMFTDDYVPTTTERHPFEVVAKLTVQV